MFDPVSILVVTMLSSAMSMAILGSLRPAGIPGVARWMGANALSVVGLVLFALQRVAPPVLGILVANGVFALAIVLMLEGCRQFFGLRPSLPAAYAGCALVMACVAYWTWVSADINARIAVVSIFHAGIYATIGWTAGRGRPPGRPAYSYRFVTVAASLGALGHLSRGFVYASGWERQAVLLQPTPLNIGFLALGILALPALSIGMVMLAHDRMAERLERWANLDELTGALTRRAFIARAEALLGEASATGRPLSLAILDIDHFKSINDAYGHAAGDDVLARFGRLVSVNVRTTDLFGRLGGEEFAVLFPGTGRGDALTRIDALRAKARADQRVAARHGASTPDRGVTFSAGIDEYRSGDSLALLMARVDTALYAAKTSGRDRVMAA